MNRSRRQFLRDSLAMVGAGTALSCSAEPSRVQDASTSRPLPDSQSNGDPKPKIGPLVVRANRPKIRAEGGGFDPAVVDEMLGACLTRLTNTTKPADAWKALFSPKDRVALKVNTLGGKGLSTNPAVVEAIVRGLVGIGVDENNILVWDRFNRELIRAGFKINTSGKGYRCAGTEGRYESEITTHGKIGGFLSPLLTRFPTALINVPLVKDHNLAGVAIGMKNLYGVIDNPNRYHNNNCDPYIADMADLPIIREKQRLVVCDALFAQYEAGPAYNPRYRWPANSLLAATDPVALDTTGWQMIEAKRREAGLKPLVDVGRPPRWLETAAKRGLGENDPKKIELAEV